MTKYYGDEYKPKHLPTMVDALFSADGWQNTNSTARKSSTRYYAVVDAATNAVVAERVTMATARGTMALLKSQFGITRFHLLESYTALAGGHVLTETFGQRPAHADINPIREHTRGVDYLDFEYTGWDRYRQRATRKVSRGTYTRPEDARNYYGVDAAMYAANLPTNGWTVFDIRTMAVWDTGYRGEITRELMESYGTKKALLNFRILPYSQAVEYYLEVKHHGYRVMHKGKTIAMGLQAELTKWIMTMNKIYRLPLEELTVEPVR